MEAFHVCHVALGSVGDQSLRSDEWKAGVEDCRSMTLEGENVYDESGITTKDN